MVELCWLAELSLDVRTQAGTGCGRATLGIEWNQRRTIGGSLLIRYLGNMACWLLFSDGRAGIRNQLFSFNDKYAMLTP